MSSGIILINKPEGITSAAVVARLRKILNIKRIGHAGTLDPMATGLLVCLIGHATRLAQYAEKGDKLYSGSIELGRSTDTDDKTGKTISISEDLPSAEDVINCARDFVGQISQLPPQVSALKINGKRAYALVRKGAVVPLRPRLTKISSFTIWPESDRIYNFRIECGVGTYIRSIARDIGIKLNCGGTLHTLIRERSYPYSLEDAYPLDKVDQSSILPWATLFPSTQKVSLPKDMIARIKNGDLRNLTAQLDDILGVNRTFDSKHLVYRSVDCDSAGGLLVRHDNGNWQIGVNLLGG